MVLRELGGEISSSTLELKFLSIDFTENTEYDNIRACMFPNGFMFFRYRIEIYVPRLIEETHYEDRLNVIKRMLAIFWKHNYAAVAVCDFEKVLPHRGGYNQLELPWPEI